MESKSLQREIGNHESEEPARTSGPGEQMPGRAAQFASALIGNLMIGMLSLMAMEWWDPDRPTARLWAIPAATVAAELAFALFARWRWNWRAFLAGTLCAAGFLLVIAGCLIGFLVFIYT